jgi:hypothetical protein
MAEQMNLKEQFRSAFKGMCLHALIESYKNAFAAKSVDKDWEEDNITIHLIDKMEALDFVKERQITIIPQYPIYDNEMINEGKNVKTAPIIDMKLNKWFSKDKIEFTIEAKNLCENDWTKSKGTNVSASYYKNRYINTGIEHFVSGYYPFGCLVGYVLQGNVIKIVGDINKIIVKKALSPRIEIIENANSINDYPHCYTSDNLNKTFVLDHIFLVF